MEGRSSRSTVSKKAPDLSLSGAKETAYRFLSYRDRSSHEIVSKLGEKGFSKEIVSEVVAFLTEAGYLNDARFARQWARSRMETRRLGPVRLKGELQKKGIAPEEIMAVLGALSEETELPLLAEEALLRKFKGSASLQEPKVRQRAFDFLRRKGFNTDTILKVFKRAASEQPDLD